MPTATTCPVLLEYTVYEYGDLTAPACTYMRVAELPVLDHPTAEGTAVLDGVIHVGAVLVHTGHVPDAHLEAADGFEHRHALTPDAHLIHTPHRIRT